MKVATKMSGTVDVSADRIIKMPFGLFGFEDYTDFALIDSEYPPFVWLQSMQEKNLAFLLLDPFLISDDYEADIDDSELAKIGIEVLMPSKKRRENRCLYFQEKSTRK